ncbi:MAG: hypothetical protein M3Y18_00200 [Candidatus Eremiobacteraeota bacterium]|nr:hypothetical protein [Candidatus Eremiobacteraeota bacterium]
MTTLINTEPLVRVTVTVPRSLADRLTDMRGRYRVSVSALVELAMIKFLREAAEAEEMEHHLKGASLRRRRTAYVRGGSLGVGA